MLYVKTDKQLADVLETTVGKLYSVARDSNRFFEEMVLLDPSRPDKRREIINVVGLLRTLQTNLLCNLLKPNLEPLPHSHGGISGRNILTNAQSHIESTCYFATDIENFYPTVKFSSIFYLFVNKFACSNSVAWLCAKLCTHRGHLAQGLIASPILADRLLAGADQRIAGMCTKLAKDSCSEVRYTRFVDDLTISAQFPVESGSTPELVVRILRTHGFKVNRQKHEFGRFSDGGRITKLCIKRGKIDVSPEYLSKLDDQLQTARLLSNGESIKPYFYTRQQILGRIHFVGWINPNRFKSFIMRFNTIDWNKSEEEARSKGLIVSRKRLIKK